MTSGRCNQRISLCVGVPSNRTNTPVFSAPDNNSSSPGRNFMSGKVLLSRRTTESGTSWTSPAATGHQHGCPIPECTSKTIPTASTQALTGRVRQRVVLSLVADANEVVVVHHGQRHVWDSKFLSTSVKEKKEQATFVVSVEVNTKSCDCATGTTLKNWNE